MTNKQTTIDFLIEKYIHLKSTDELYLVLLEKYKLNPKDFHVNLNLAIYYATNNKPIKAIEHYLNITESENKKAFIHYNIAHLYLKLKIYSKALEHTNLSLNNTPSIPGLKTKKLIYLHLKKFKESHKILLQEEKIFTKELTSLKQKTPKPEPLITEFQNKIQQLNQNKQIIEYLSKTPSKNFDSDFNTKKLYISFITKLTNELNPD